MNIYVVIEKTLDDDHSIEELRISCATFSSKEKAEKCLQERFDKVKVDYEDDNGYEIEEFNGCQASIIDRMYGMTCFYLIEIIETVVDEFE